MHLSAKNFISLLSALLFFFGFPLEMQAENISEVTVDRSHIDFQRNDTATMGWKLSEEAVVTVFICDMNGRIVRYLVREEKQEAREYGGQWDGRDDQGEPCPNGLYVPIIKTDSALKGTAFYNPTALNWGEDVQANNLQFDGSQAVSFQVDHLAFGRLRVGLNEGGPVFKTLAPWQLWSPGRHTVPWNGRDHNNVHQVANKKKFSLSFNAFIPPENCITVIGSIDAFTGDAQEQFPVHPPGSGNHNQFSIEPGSQRGDPDITVSFRKDRSKKETDPGNLSGTAHLHVSFSKPQKNLASFTTKTELYLYVDDQFIDETPIDGLPASISFDTRKFPNGEHIATVNLYTGDDRVGIHVEKITINN